MTLPRLPSNRYAGILIAAIGLALSACQTTPVQNPTAGNFVRPPSSENSTSETQALPVNRAGDDVEAFAVGSTKEQVGLVMGPPNETSPDLYPSGSEVWTYGRSSVVFVGGRVTRWDNADGSLRAKSANSSVATSTSGKLDTLQAAAALAEAERLRARKAMAALSRPVGSDDVLNVPSESDETTAAATPSYPTSHASGYGGGSVHVSGYYRKNGTYVSSYTRSSPGSGRRR
ncbi:MAG: hypothetical protein JWO82_1229 [Akkermansiaceae bacterium]|nr:hypothetical protein [Akkermansiaceae bacterium]